jgi:hypothetical protein
MAVAIQLRGGTTAQWASADPVLAEREVGIDTDLEIYKVGDGVTAWSSLPVFSGKGPQGVQGDPGNDGADGADAEDMVLGPDTYANWETSDPTLTAGQIALVSNAQALKYGDGVTAWTALPPFVSSVPSPALLAGTIVLNALNGVGNSTLAAGTNRLTLVPFLCTRRISVTHVGTTYSATGGNHQTSIYASDPHTGVPTDLLSFSSSVATSTTVIPALAFEFLPGRLYWIGVHTSSTPTHRALAASTSFNLGIGNQALSSTTIMTQIRRTVTYGFGAPDPWAFVVAELTSGINPIIYATRA